MAKRFVIPFATSGDKSVTPDATDPAGAISYSQGWPVAYQLADTDPNYRPVGRQEMNGVLFDVTGAIAEVQALGFPEWVPVAGLVTPYAINAVLRHNGNNWRNTVANNSAEPGIDATWVLSNESPGTITTAGTSPNFTLAPSPAIPAYAIGQNFRVRFSATPSGVPTINVSGRGSVNLKQYNSAGAKVQAVIAIDQITNIEYDGVDFVVIDQLPSGAGTDFWRYMPLGIPFAVFDHIAGVSIPSLASPDYRYIKLTAADAFNSGVLTSESVTGSGPLLLATGVVSLVGSPLNGQTVQLINTDRRVVRGGPSGTLEQDQAQGHRHLALVTNFINNGTLNSSPGSSFAGGINTTPTTGAMTTDTVNGAARFGDETRAKAINATYYMRIK